MKRAGPSERARARHPTHSSSGEASGSPYVGYLMSIYVLICVRGGRSIFNEQFSAGAAFVCSFVGDNTHLTAAADGGVCESAVRI